MRTIADGLLTDEASPRLIGGRDRETGRIVFPDPADDRHDAVPLRQDGVLWSYTVQRFRPKSPPYAGPDAFTPWIVAYVELPGEVIVEARLIDVDPAGVRIGMPVRLTTTPLDPAAPDGPHMPAFVPAEMAA